MTICISVFTVKSRRGSFSVSVQITAQQLKVFVIEKLLQLFEFFLSFLSRLFIAKLLFKAQ